VKDALFFLSPPAMINREEINLAKSFYSFKKRQKELAKKKKQEEKRQRKLEKKQRKLEQEALALGENAEQHDVEAEDSEDSQDIIDKPET